MIPVSRAYIAPKVGIAHGTVTLHVEVEKGGVETTLTSFVNGTLKEGLPILLDLTKRPEDPFLENILADAVNTLKERGAFVTVRFLSDRPPFCKGFATLSSAIMLHPNIEWAEYTVGELILQVQQGEREILEPSTFGNRNNVNTTCFVYIPKRIDPKVLITFLKKVRRPWSVLTDPVVKVSIPAPMELLHE